MGAAERARGTRGWGLPERGETRGTQGVGGCGMGREGTGL